ncbi:putative glycosyl hydrolase [Salinibacterium xinjiangense]|uniref:Alpha-mannosidase n=1 Tax=Salinibacterium xinjiangense TaxID=386302 RepID=A0A2C8ZV44_9MICO|nr:glycoside hydrolase family 38 C-terminal domain-containing protein [Salinibacterium xinjiangense]GGL05481.1 putative glycosyl hydrolase [Salinibacterium xinjiangense]SOE69715.1 alpha-mannosidase [Salinibacterium xinjiangense]
MHDNRALVEARIERFTRERLLPAVYRHRSPLEIEAWEVSDEPVPFAEARRQPYVPFAVGSSWGRPWSTVWFHITGTVPSDWNVDGTRPEVVVDLGYNITLPGFQAEGTAFDPQGRIIKAIEPLNSYLPAGEPGSAVDVYLEAAANPNVAGTFTFGVTELGDKATAGSAHVYQLRTLELALLDIEVWELVQDVWTLAGLMAELPVTLPRRLEILMALDRMVDAVDPENVSGTAAAGRAALADVLARPAYASAHKLDAVGHAHLDSAWLWPVRETVRKVARTFSNVLALMEQDPDFTFAASSAQQFAWLKQYYPELFERVKAQVAAGRFVPVGGMWVESDTNLPGGEAMARQFVAGKRFFMEELGVEPLEVWLPDSFGYSAALPQIVTAAGSKWFLTQKISWNETNRMPHHTFWWEGIDGTRVFTHFPPVDTYSSDISGRELAKAERQYAEKGAGTTSLLPFGWGDGGGGPTREMLAAAQRTADLEGSPRVSLSTPQRFFESAQAEYADAPVWSGELYLEFHRGTYTSQAKTKRGNRRSEHLLREAELWASAATVLAGGAYPYDALESVWRTVLLQQFHDILPGSSIAWVHQEAERNYAEVAVILEGIITEAIAAIAGAGDDVVTFNASPFARNGVHSLGASVEAPSAASIVTQTAEGFVLENSAVRVVIDARGLIVSMLDRIAGRETIPVGETANLLQLFRDTPNQWDAWDIDESYKHSGVDLTEVDSIAITDDGHGVRLVRSFGASRLEQTLWLDGETGALDIHVIIDWHETQKLLKLAFPLAVHADRAASEVQFGHVYRPTHANTSWDAARFETSAHRWVHVGEPGFGVAIANDASYGYDIRRQAVPGAGTSTVVRVSLLRAALFPDPDADQGRQEFRFSVRVGAGIADAVEEGYRLNLPLRQATGAADCVAAPFVSVDAPGIVVEAVKLAEDRTGDVVVRLYEALGATSSGMLRTGFSWIRVDETDLLERVIDRLAVATVDDDGVALTLRPFQIVTLRFAGPGR